MATAEATPVMDVALDIIGGSMIEQLEKSIGAPLSDESKKILENMAIFHAHQGALFGANYVQYGARLASGLIAYHATAPIHQQETDE